MPASAELCAYRAARASELVRAEIERHAADIPAPIARRLLALATIARDEAGALDVIRVPAPLPVAPRSNAGAVAREPRAPNVIPFPLAPRAR